MVNVNKIPTKLRNYKIFQQKVHIILLNLIFQSTRPINRVAREAKI